jgi:hypothetical protein
MKRGQIYFLVSYRRPRARFLPIPAGWPSTGTVDAAPGGRRTAPWQVIQKLYNLPIWGDRPTEEVAKSVVPVRQWFVSISYNVLIINVL